jgi:hypothetical protein
MGSDLINGNLSSKLGIVYVTDNDRYAKAEKDEMQLMTGDKYEITTMKLYIVRRKVP